MIEEEYCDFCGEFVEWPCECDEDAEECSFYENPA